MKVKKRRGGGEQGRNGKSTEKRAKRAQNNQSQRGQLSPGVATLTEEQQSLRESWIESQSSPATIVRLVKQQGALRSAVPDTPATSRLSTIPAQIRAFRCQLANRKPLTANSLVVSCSPSLSVCSALRQRASLLPTFHPLASDIS